MKNDTDILTQSRADGLSKDLLMPTLLVMKAHLKLKEAAKKGAELGMDLLDGKVATEGESRRRMNEFLADVRAGIECLPDINLIQGV